MGAIDSGEQRMRRHLRQTLDVILFDKRHGMVHGHVYGITHVFFSSRKYRTHCAVYRANQAYQRGKKKLPWNPADVAPPNYVKQFDVSRRSREMDPVLMRHR